MDLFHELIIKIDLLVSMNHWTIKKKYDKEFHIEVTIET